MPWCQVRRGNIIVDFFTARAGERDQRRPGPLRRPAAGARCFALLAWRTALGGLNAYSTPFRDTMMLGFPEWIVYALMVPPLRADRR